MQLFQLQAFVILLPLVLSGCYEDIIPMEVGSPAPPARITLLNGEVADVTAHQGKGQVITFMSSWCPCSNDSIPMIKEAYNKYGKGEQNQLTFLMIGIQDAESKFEAFVEKWQIAFPVGYDDDNDIARAYGIKQPPTTIFVNRDGKVQRIFYGNIKDLEEEFRQWTEELL